MTIDVAVRWADELKVKAKRLIARAEGEMQQRLKNINVSLNIVRNQVVDDMAVKVAHEKRLKELERRLGYYTTKLKEMEGH